MKATHKAFFRPRFKAFSQLALGLSLLAGLALQAAPAQAAIQRSADFSQGSAVGIGIYGLSYDYGIGFFSAGLAIQSQSSFSFSNPLNNPLRPSLRLAARFYQNRGLSADVLGGLLFDPGYVGERSLLVPDIGLGVAYDFRKAFKLPFALRMNLTLGVNDYSSRYPDNGEPGQQANFFQKLGFGPQTSVELAWLPTKDLEITLGGGTLLGMRMKF